MKPLSLSKLLRGVFIAIATLSAVSSGFSSAYPEDGETYFIRNSYLTNRYLDVFRRATTNGSEVVGWPLNKGENQQWKIEYVAPSLNGMRVRLKSVQSGLYLSAVKEDYRVTGSIFQHALDNAYAQEWMIETHAQWSEDTNDDDFVIRGYAGVDPVPTKHHYFGGDFNDEFYLTMGFPVSPGESINPPVSTWMISISSYLDGVAESIAGTMPRGSQIRWVFEKVTKDPEPPTIPEIPIYRFFRRDTGAHFFTASQEEKQSILDSTSREVWVFEGSTFAVTTGEAPNAFPVYRLFNQNSGAHFYTISVDEKDTVVTTMPQFSLEGVAFYAYLTQEPNTLPVYRFYNMETRSHFFTIHESERDAIIATMSGVFSYDGIAFYAYPASQ